LLGRKKPAARRAATRSSSALRPASMNTGLKTSPSAIGRVAAGSR
jgi:hypothetical protein